MINIHVCAATISVLSCFQNQSSDSKWDEGYKLAAAMNFRWPQCASSPLRTIIPNASEDGLRILKEMLFWDPQKRPTCQQCLRHNFFKVGQNLGPKMPAVQAPRQIPQPSHQPLAQQQSTHRQSPTKPFTFGDEKSPVLPTLNKQPQPKPSQTEIKVINQLHLNIVL